MSLCCLVYVSRRCAPTSQMNLDELRSIHQVSIKNNRKLAVTGLLLATKHRYIQVLEGERQVVHDLYGHIEKDPRHTNPRIRQSCFVRTRTFSDWSMTVVCVDHIGQLLYNVGDTNNDFDPYDLSQESLNRLLEMSAHQKRLFQKNAAQAKAIASAV